MVRLPQAAVTHHQHLQQEIQSSGLSQDMGRSGAETKMMQIVWLPACERREEKGTHDTTLHPLHTGPYSIAASAAIANSQISRKAPEPGSVHRI